MTKKIFIYVIALSFVINFLSINVFADSPQIGVTYQSHVQNIGWQNPWSADGSDSGTTGKSFRIEALKIKLINAPVGAKIKYQAHVQNIGWQSWMSDGQEIGTDGQGLRLEAIKISLEGIPEYSVQYRVHIQNVGWQSWMSDGQEAGTDGQGLRIEAIDIRIVPTVHPTALSLNKSSDTLSVGGSDTLVTTISPSNSTDQHLTWTSSNNSIASVDSSGKVTGISAGNATITATTLDGNKTASCAVTVNNVGVTGISLNKTSATLPINGSDTLIPTISPSNSTDQHLTWTSSNNSIASVDSSGKITGVSTGNTTITAATEDGNKTTSCNVTVTVADPSITYQTHVQNVGWQSSVNNDEISGTVGQSLRVEALKINLVNAPVGARIKYQSYVENIGWQSSVYNNTESGTNGQGLRIEALKISLENMPGYSIEYRVQVQNIGWQPWVMNGNIIGTEGRSLRVEAIQIKLIKSIDVQYQINIQDNGWQTPVNNGDVAGTNGQPLRIESFNTKLVNAPVGASIKYQAQVQNIGWQDWVNDGQTAGTAWQGLRIEAIKLQLVNAPNYNVQYQVFVQNLGWQPWVQDGQIAGTVGLGLRIEGLRIRVVSNPDATTMSLPIQTPTAYKLANYLDSNDNIASINARAVQLHDGITSNNCVFFSSEALRRIGFNVPTWMCNTKNYIPYLLNSGWKRYSSVDDLAPGDICFNVPDSSGFSSHTFVFMGWVNPDDHTLAYVADNQTWGNIHIRSVVQTPDFDPLDFFVRY